MRNFGSQPRQAGVTLIAALVAISIVGIVAVLASGILTQTSLFRRTVASGEAYRDLEDSFKLNIAQALTTQMPAVCGGSPLNISQPVGGSTISMAVSSQIAAFPASAPSGTTAAVNTCKGGQFRSPPGNQDFYFCLNFNGLQQQSAASTSMAGAAALFAEVRAQLVDEQTGTPLNCAAYQQRIANNGMGPVNWEIGYSLFWYSHGNPPVYVRRNGFYYGLAH